MSKISLSLHSKGAGGVDLPPDRRVDPTLEQLTTSFQAAMKVLFDFGMVARMVEVVKVFYHQRPGVTAPEMLNPVFEVILVGPRANTKIHVLCECAWRSGNVVTDVEKLAGLLIDAIDAELGEHERDHESDQVELRRVRQSISSAATA